ncbi:MAG: alanine dehydrogenase [Bacteroidetes bacterium]|nr:alanine dehydrogenase [Bacteroidota bacterium]
MTKVTIGLVHEGRVPPDKRVPFTPLQVQEILQLFPNVSVVCQHSEVRCFSDAEYASLDIPILNDMGKCDILMGIKEVQIPDLIGGKTYLFFSHTLKKQPYNRKLLQEILRKKIRLIDYEALRDIQGNRIVAFGRYAGIVGAFNGLWTYGKRFGLFELRRACECFDINDLKLELRKVKLPPVKILLTGAGRVAKGAMETLDTVGIRKVSPEDYLNKAFDYPVYVQLNSADYHFRKEGGPFNRDEFHKYPGNYISTFRPFTAVTDLLLAGAYWNPKAPALFTLQDMKEKTFRIRVIADITCDINGSVPSTKRATSIVDPLYDYDPITDKELPPLSGKDHITVMAIDNLPCELPRSASEEFGRDLIDRVLRPLLQDDPEGVIARGTIARDGKLTPHFDYLKDYVAE